MSDAPTPDDAFELARQISALCANHPVMVVDAALAEVMSRSLCFIPDDKLEAMLASQRAMVLELRAANIEIFRENTGTDPRAAAEEENRAPADQGGGRVAESGESR